VVILAGSRFRPIKRVVATLVLVTVLATGVAVSIPSSRHSMLRWAGWALVAEDAPAKADIIVVSSDSLNAGYLEAADLVKAGYATRVAVFSLPVSAPRAELARRGVAVAEPTTEAVRILKGLGVSDVQLIAPVVGTVDGGRVLQEWCAANSIHSLLFVSVTDHSRRTRRVLDRSVGRQGVRVMVRPARWSQFDPDSWWRSRNGQRTEIMEMQKLCVDLLLHPF
jgi:uncharacterized SAM-binding protein YcdF (DUF218 family)